MIEEACGASGQAFLGLGLTSILFARYKGFRPAKERNCPAAI